MKNIRYITALRFPLALLVVLIHCDISERAGADAGQFALIAPLCQLLSKGIATMAVPAFFAISGYLFFLGKQTFTLSDYREKLRRRAKTLLVPYLAWNAVAFLIYAAKDVAAGQPLQFPPCADLFWGIRPLGEGGVNILGQPIGPTFAPVQVPLWFVRDLIVLVALSPVLHFLIRRMGVVWLALIGVANFVLWPNFGGMSLTGAFWFSIGAWFAVRSKDPLATTRRFLPAAAIACVASFALSVALRDVCAPASNFLRVLYTMSAIVCLIHTADKLTHRREPNHFLASSTFFIYAFHTIVLFPIIAVLPRLGNNLGYAAQAICYVGTFAIAVGGSLAAYYVVSRCGKWTAPLTGNWK